MFAQIKSIIRVYWPVCLGVIYLTGLILCNEVPADDGDGLEHFAIAQDSWIHPVQLLNHWGKPLFTLFFSPFAQLGFHVYALANVLVYTLSCCLVFRLFNRIGIRVHLAQLFALLLLTVPDYITSSIAGLTEPFFGMLLLLAFYYSFTERWFFAALVVSFLPFARSEGMLIVALFGVILLIFKHWKYVPVLFTGYLIYACIGYLTINQWNWYFENDPYPAVSVYGSGPWNTYIKNVHRHMGFPNFVLSCMTVLIFFRFRKPNIKPFKKAHFLALVGIGIYIGILVVHSYLWYTGQKGALGLSRLGILGMPLLTLGCLIFIATEDNLRLANPRDVRFVVLLIAVSWTHVFIKNDFPNRATPMQIALKKTAEYLKENRSKFKKAYYFHPMIAYYSGTTTKAMHDYLNFRFIYLEHDIKNLFKPGDILVRDSYFGAREQGLPLDKIAKFKNIQPVYSIFSTSPDKTIFGEDQSIVIYKIEKDSLTVPEPTLRTEKIQKQAYTIASNKLYIDLEEKLELPSTKYPCRSLIIELSDVKNLPDEVDLVVDGGGFYAATRLKSGEKMYRIQVTQPIRTMKLYVYNPVLHDLSFKLKCISWENIQNRGL